MKAHTRASSRSVERAIDFEIARQEAALRAGEPLIQETRGWDDDRGVTYHMRTKETSDDYRYFPEPDLPPLRIDPAWLEEIRAGRERLGPGDLVLVHLSDEVAEELAVNPVPGVIAAHDGMVWSLPDRWPERR